MAGPRNTLAKPDSAYLRLFSQTQVRSRVVAIQDLFQEVAAT